MSVIILIVIIIFGFWLHGKLTNTSADTKYTLALVSKGTVISTVSGSGQVSTSNSINIMPTVSGIITSVKVKPGDMVYTGQNLFSIDATDAQKGVRDAETSLQSAELALKTSQAQNSNTDIDQQTAVNNAYNNLLNSSPDAVPNNQNDISTATNLASPIITGNYVLGKEGTINIHFYPSSGGLSFSVSGLTNGSSIASTSIASPIGNSGLYLTLPAGNNFNSSTDWVINIPNKKASNYLSNYNNYQSALQTQKEASSGSTVTELNIETKQLAVTQAENALQDAKDTLAKYYINAPFSGTIASVPVSVGDNASSGTTLGTIITNQELAVVVLNEVDVAKINLGEKSTITFDAIPDLTIAGVVSEIDSVGSVSQGVVNYNVKISFATQDTRVKSGMSVTADIITNVAQDVVVIPNSAVKTASDGSSYVQIFDASVSGPVTATQTFTTALLPKQIPVQVGLSDGTSTEITSGLKEGDVIIVKSVAGTTAKTTPNILSAVAGNANKGGGGAGRLGN